MSTDVELKMSKQVSLQTVFSGIQAIVLLGSIAGAFMLIGRRDAALDNQGERIKDLALISSDLAKAISNLSANDREFNAKMDSILMRLDKLEKTK